MSWEPYLETLVQAGFHHACIAGHNGSTWANTSSFKVLPKEVINLCTILSNDNAECLMHAQQKGFTVQGRSYTMNRFEEPEDDMSFLVGRCKQHGSASRGVAVARTSQTIIIGIHDPIFAQNISFGKCNVALFQLAETLTSMNF